MMETANGTAEKIFLCTVFFVPQICRPLRRKVCRTQYGSEVIVNPPDTTKEYNPLASIMHSVGDTERQCNAIKTNQTNNERIVGMIG